MRTTLAMVFVLAATTSVALATPSVIASPAAGAGGLLLDGEGSSATHVVKIADVSLSTGASSGFTVSITSGSLTKADGRTPVPFQVQFVADGASAPLASAFTTPSGTTLQWSSTGPGAVEKDLYVKYTPVPLQDPGPYTANVDIDVVDN